VAVAQHNQTHQAKLVQASEGLVVQEAVRHGTSQRHQIKPEDQEQSVKEIKVATAKTLEVVQAVAEHPQLEQTQTQMVSLFPMLENQAETAQPQVLAVHQSHTPVVAVVEQVCFQDKQPQAEQAELVVAVPEVAEPQVSQLMVQMVQSIRVAEAEAVLAHLRR